VAWLSIAIVIVLLAFTLSAVRLLLPGMSEYKAQLEAVAGNFLQQPVQIGSLDAAWHGLSPVLKLNQVVIQDQQFPNGTLTIAEVQVALDVVDSLMQRRWLTAGIRFIGIGLSLETDLRSHRKVDWGLESFNWLLQQESITLEEVHIEWTDSGLFEQPVRFTDLSLKLVNEGRRHQFLLQTELPASFGKRLKIAADLNGQGTDYRDWQGRVYLDTEGFALDAVKQVFREVPFNARGRMDLELWAGIRDSQLNWGSGSLVIHDALFENVSADKQRIGADLLSSDFFLQSTAGGWELGLREFELERDNRKVWPSSEVNLNFETGAELRIRGDASTLDLDELHSLTPLLPWVDEEALLMLDRLEPVGLLREAQFEFNYAEGAAPRFSARARIEDLHLAASAGLPGVSGLSGWLEGNLQSGYLHLNSKYGSLLMPSVFPQPLELSRLTGIVHWQRYADLFRIESRQLKLESGELGMLARWQLDWPYDKPTPWLDMQLAIDDLPLTQVRRHLPEKAMPAKAAAWLERAFVDGIATNARVLMQGRLDQMPFDNGEGRFEVRFGFEDVVLDYHPAWGRLGELGGSAVFSGRKMQVTGTSGRIQNSLVKRVVAVIKDLKKPLLQIEGTVGGTLPGMLEYISNSPLGKRFGGFVEKVDAGGDARLQLDLQVPLVRSLGRIRVNGVVALEDNDLIVKEDDIRFTNIKGLLGFTEKGVTADKLQARLLDQPVSVEVYQREADTGSTTVVDIQGRLGFVELLPEISTLAPRIQGMSEWQALLEVQNQPQVGQAALELLLRSDLKGVAIDLPHPFGKRAAESRELRLRGVPGQESRYPLKISYGKHINAAVLLSAKKRAIDKANVRFSDGIARLPDRREIHLSGRIDQLDVGRWISLFGANTAGDYKAPVVTVDLAVDKFLLAGRQVEGISAESRMPDPWHFQLRGEGASGWVRWVAADRANPAKLLANLQYLVLLNQGAHQDSESLAFEQPNRLPEMDISIDALTWSQRQLGSIKLVGKRSRYGISFETLAMQSKAIGFNGQGAWLDIGGQQSTRFNAAIDGGELGELAGLLGTNSAIKGGRLNGDIVANWPGSPADFSLATVEAEFNLRADEGRLLSVDKGGAGKLLSLFSLNSLQRRLTLDFTDVYKEGFSFDKMQGRFVVSGGNATTDNFTIKGTSANIEIKGRTGLVAQDYDQRVTVIPQVSSTLPIAGAIAGGPVVGAAVFLADRLVGDKFNRITRVRYQVSGSWADPVYTKLEQNSDDDNSGVGIDVD
jgi:uncharacterized protein (TIGR02099 family)